MISDWAAALQESLVERAETVPDGWKTVKAISEELGKSESHTNKLVRDMMQAKRAEVKTFRIVHKSGIRPTPHYRIKTAAKAA